MTQSRRFLHGLAGICLLLSTLLLSACSLPEKVMPPFIAPVLPTLAATQHPTSLPQTSQATREASPSPMQDSLPMVMQAASQASPAPAGISKFVSSPTPAGQLLQIPASTEAPYNTLLFTGVIVPARCVQAAIDARGDANYVYDEVRELISSADLAVGTLNTSLSDSSTHTGCVESYVLVSDSRSASAAASAGFDVMSVATNHIKNCNGASCRNYFNQAFLDTLENLRVNGVLPVGAGMSQAEALRPVVVELQGVRFGFVSLGMVEPMAFAGESSPGIAELTDDNLRAAIQATRQVSDVVIAMPHWGPEDTSQPNSYQLHFAQLAVEAGADVVVGNHTHVVQAIQQVDGVDIFYGLGNFIFDQTWDLAHQQGVILRLYFYGSTYTGYDLIPTHVDGDGTVHIANDDEAAQVLQRIEEASQELR